MKNIFQYAVLTATFLTTALVACVPEETGNGQGNPPAPICPGDDEVRFVSTNPDTCAVIRYTCNPGEIGYSDPECGCGCELPECPEASSDLTYASYDFEQCKAMRFACPVGFSHWSSDCGCGCARDEAGAVGDACGGIMGLQCGDGLFCAFEDSAQCGWADQMGTCAARPDACITLYRPVCGCDGRNYSNSCAAASHGVSVDYDGECTTTPVQN